RRAIADAHSTSVAHHTIMVESFSASVCTAFVVGSVHTNATIADASQNFIVLLVARRGAHGRPRHLSSTAVAWSQRDPLPPADVRVEHCLRARGATVHCHHRDAAR